MLQIELPGSTELCLKDLVLDFNGTLACDGELITGVRERLLLLSKQLQIHVITADTFGSVGREMTAVPCETAIIPGEAQKEAKLLYIEELGAQTVVAVGNGRNDQLMLKAARLGMVTVQAEGAAIDAMLAADLVVSDILAALDLLLKPQRLVATLRM